MDFKDIKNKTDEELLVLAEDLKEELRALRFKVGVQSLKQNDKISKSKKNIAKIKTELRMRFINK